jgi:hypothetical protein
MLTSAQDQCLIFTKKYKKRKVICKSHHSVLIDRRMLGQAFTILLLAVVMVPAKHYKEPRLPLKFQLNPQFSNHIEEKIIGGYEVTPYSIPYQVKNLKSRFF